MNSPSGSSTAEAAHDHRTGLVYAITAYVMWGLLPIFFLALVPAGAIEIVAWRVIFSLFFCAAILTVTRTWPKLVAIAKQPRLLVLLGLAAGLILLNWIVYVFATLSGHVVEGSLGYFINPIVTVLLGVFVLREKLRPAQWVAVGIAAIAVLVLAIGYGQFPWISLVLAFSFGFYGFVKKWVGPRVDAVSGLTLETAWLIPAAVVMLWIVSVGDGIVLGTAGLGNTLLLISAGVVTAVPLLLFAASSRRLPLIWIGLTQFLTPVLQFSFSAFVMGEPMPPERWVGFVLVWIALVILMSDMVIRGRAARRASPLPG